MRKTLFALTLTFCASSYGAIIAYDYPVSVGNQSVFNGSLGMDFNVNTAISISSLGVYDSGADGLNRQIAAYIYDRTTHAAVASLTFGTGNTGTLIHGARFLSLPGTLTLLAGFQGSIVAENYGELEPNLNNVAGSLSNLNDGGGAISFVGSSRWGDAGTFPTFVDLGPANRYGAGTFQFDVAAQTSPVPEPATVTLFVAGLLGLAGLRRRTH